MLLLAKDTIWKNWKPVSQDEIEISLSDLDCSKDEWLSELLWLIHIARFSCQDQIFLGCCWMPSSWKSGSEIVHVGKSSTWTKVIKVQHIEKMPFKKLFKAFFNIFLHPSKPRIFFTRIFDYQTFSDLETCFAICFGWKKFGIL